MSSRYEWKNHSECFSFWKYSFLDLGNILWKKKTLSSE
jgi:hypothetical protein